MSLPAKVRAAVLLATVGIILETAIAASGAAAAERYIVTLSDGADPAAVAQRHGATRKRTYRAALQGFAAELTAQQREAVRSDPDVVQVAPDRAFALEPGRALAASKPPAQVVPSGVRRIQADVPAPHRRVNVAVIDSGIDRHPDLRENLARRAKSCVPAESSPFADEFGHGTQVAGTIGAADNRIGVVGVNPNVELISVKVYDASGMTTWADLLCGVDWVTANTARLGIAAVNMSLAGPGDFQPFHDALIALRNAGATVVVAAGNDAADTVGYMPASYDDAVITVSALADSDGLPGGLGTESWAGADDDFASFSNYGREVDLGAPGVNILSTATDGDYALLSGTSMSTAHVTGAVSRYLATNPTATWAETRDALIATGEAAGDGHSDVLGIHPEPVVRVRDSW